MPLSKIQTIGNQVVPNLGRRNMVINGAMQAAQRGTSFTSVSGSAYHLDRFRTGMGDTSARFTVTQATAGLNGFGNSLKYDCTTAESSLSNADARLFVTQRIEGQNLQQLKKGTSDAEKITVSFYVKSTKTGTYILNLIDHDNNRQISKAYTISSSGTWEQKSLTFDGDTTGALGNDNGNSFSLNWWLISGTNYGGGTLATSWQGYAGASDYEDAAVGQVNLGDNTSNTWEITGIQMEVGDSATDFEHRSVGEELALCQRYYQNSFEHGNAPGTSTDSDDSQLTTSWTDGNAPFPPFSTTMRAKPTITFRPRGSTSTGTVNNGGSTRNASATNISNKGVSYIAVTSGTGGQYNAFSYECSAEI